MQFPVISSRLRLRPFVISDWPFVLDLLNSEGWLKNIGDRKVYNEAQARKYIEEGPMASYSAHGFGLGVVELLESGKSIGVCGLLKRPFLDAPDLGFAFLPAFIGKGYGYEMVHALVQELSASGKYKKLFAFCNPANIASSGLLLKLGFVYDGELQVEGKPIPSSLYVFH